MSYVSPKILILTATRSEAVPVVSSLSRPVRVPGYVARIWAGLLNDVPIIIACTGIGMQKTRTVLDEIGKLIDGSVVLNTGIAGALSDCIHPGDWCEITGVVNAGDHKQYCAAAITGVVPPVRLLSVDDPVTDRVQAENLYRQHSAEVVDMEGYAVAEFCELHGVDWHMLKMISDYADINAHKDYSAQLEVYSSGCVDMLRRLIERLRLVNG
jgi:nucleoside phosphorylase